MIKNEPFFESLSLADFVNKLVSRFIFWFMSPDPKILNLVNSNDASLIELLVEYEFYNLLFGAFECTQTLFRWLK